MQDESIALSRLSRTISAIGLACLAAGLVNGGEGLIDAACRVHQPSRSQPPNIDLCKEEMNA
jgi:hypothetical protein